MGLTIDEQALARKDELTTMIQDGAAVLDGFKGFDDTTIYLMLALVRFGGFREREIDDLKNEADTRGLWH